MHNPEVLMSKMKKKGWSEEEIAHAHEVFKEHKLHHHIVHPAYDALMHWTVFATILLATLFLCVAFTPVLFVLKGFAWVFMLLLGFCFGVLFEVIVNDFTHLEKKHHLFFGILFPIIQFFLVLVILNYVEIYFNVLLSNIVIIAACYAVGFHLPYYKRRLFNK